MRFTHDCNTIRLSRQPASLSSLPTRENAAAQAVLPWTGPGGCLQISHPDKRSCGRHRDRFPTGRQSPGFARA